MHPDSKQIPAALGWMPLAEMGEWAGNPKKHPVENVAMIAASLKRYGFGSPIVLWGSERRIVAGHGRYRAALLRMKGDPGLYLDKDAPGPGMVPVRTMEFSSESEAAAYALTDNRTTEVNPMEAVDVAEVLRQIQGDGGDLSIPGWTDEEIAAMLALPGEDGTGGEDAGAGEPPVEPVSRTGEVYELGPHRLVCGDCGDQHVRDAALGSGVQAVVSDPPYGIDASRMTMGSGESKKARGERLSSVNAWDGVAPPVVWLLAVAPLVCLWGGNYFSGLPVSDDWLVWHKKNDGLSFAEAELAWTNFGCRVRVLQHHWSGEKKEHITQKPLPVIEWCLGFLPGACAVFDPFGGSGTTLIACAKTGRIARLIEIDPRYCDVIRRRWTQYALSAGVDPGTGRLDA